LTREEALGKVVSLISLKDPIVSSTGMLSRELFEYRWAIVINLFYIFGVDNVPFMRVDNKIL
jgi:hypothetical protein